MGAEIEFGTFEGIFLTDTLNGFKLIKNLINSYELL